MTEAWPPPQSPSQDVLGSPQPEPRRRGRGKLAIGLVGIGTLAIAGVGVALASYLGGGGAQPEDVLPSNVLGMVKLDLDPAAGQKIAVYRLSERFPSIEDKVSNQDSIKDDLLSALLEDEEDVDYEADLKPWIGDRVGLAVLPPEGDEEPEPLAAVAFTDRAAAESSLREMAAENDGEDELFFAFSEQADYVLLGTSQDSVDAAAAGTDVLADNASWKDGIDALDGDQIVTAWMDLDAVWSALPQEARAEAAEVYGLNDFELGGTIVVGARAADDYVEVVGRGLDITSPFQNDAPIGGGNGGRMVQELPVDTIAAMSITNLGPGLADFFDQAYGADDPLGIVAGAQDVGLTLPDDLRTLLGEEAVMALLGEEEGGLRTRTEDPDGAYGIAQSLLELTGGASSAQLSQTDDGIALATSPESLDAITASGGGLGDSDAFRKAVPDGDRAGLLVYVDIARAVAMSGEDLGEDAADVEQLEAFGMTSSGDNRNSTFRMRLTVRD